MLKYYENDRHVGLYCGEGWYRPNEAGFDGWGSEYKVGLWKYYRPITKVSDTQELEKLIYFIV